MHPVVIVQIKGRKFRALLHIRDSGKSHRRSSCQNNHANGYHNDKNVQLDLSVEAVKGNFTLNVCATMIKRCELLLLDNPHNEKRIEAHQHLRDIQLEDHPTKKRLPVHVILGANEYTKIRMSQVRIGRQGEPVAELTRYGWALMSPGALHTQVQKLRKMGKLERRNYPGTTARRNR
jgi:hypothetical protein